MSDWISALDNSEPHSGNMITDRGTFLLLQKVSSRKSGTVYSCAPKAVANEVLDSTQVRNCNKHRLTYN